MVIDDGVRLNSDSFFMACYNVIIKKNVARKENRYGKHQEHRCYFNRYSALKL